MSGQSPEVLALEAQVFALAPGFNWCGACATATRLLTEEEARDILRLVARYAESDAPQLDMVDALCWLMETHTRTQGPAGFVCGCAMALPEPPPPLVPRSGFYLYRLWTEGDRLLYVGVSTRLSARLRTHRRHLGVLFDHATWEECPDAASMLTAERQAIQDENPALNKSCVS